MKLDEILRVNGGRLPRLAGGAGAALQVPPSQEGYESVPGIAGLEIPFTQASKPVIEEGPFWSNITLSEQTQILEPKGIPANGYLRFVLIRLETQTAGTGGETGGDMPWSLIQTLKLEDQGGHEIYGPLSGFAAYLACKWGAYFLRPDLAKLPSFKNSPTEPACTFALPVEIAPTGLGALSNMTEATQYHIAISLNPMTAAYKKGKTPEDAPVIRLRSWTCLWPLPQGRTEPEPGAPEGRVQQQRPPLLGTVQYWTSQPAIKIAEGQNRIVFNRVGQMIRTHIFVTRNAEGERVGNVMATPFNLEWARVRFRTIDKEVARDLAFMSMTESGEDTGVYPLLYSQGEQRYGGANEVNGWLATVNTTSLALNMANWEKEGFLEIITNDVAVAAQGETGRREVPGQTAMREPRMVE
jgi:hypothetical protein